MTANSKDENPSSETRKLDPTLIAKPNLKEGGGSFGSGANVGGYSGGGGSGIGSLGSPGGGPAGVNGRGSVGGIGTSNSGGVGSTAAPSSGGLNGFGSSRGTSNSAGVGIRGGGVPTSSTSYPSGSSSTTQPKNPQQSQTRPANKPQTSTTNSSSPQTPKKSPTPKYSDSVNSIPPATRAPDRGINDRAKREVNQKSPQTDFDPHNKPAKPSSPVKITQPKPKEYDPLPDIPRREQFTEQVPRNPKKGRFGDPRISFPTNRNPENPSRTRRNPKNPGILRIENRPEVDRFFIDNPLNPPPKNNPSGFPGKIDAPSNGGQAVRAKKTPNNGGSQNSNSGGNSGQQKPTTKKQKKDLAKKYAGRDIDKLTAAEEKEFKQGYVISNDKGKKYIKRRSEADDYPPLHLSEVNGKQVIAEGPSPSNRGNSNPSTMKREFKTKFGQDAPQGDDLHHLIPVNVWKEDPIVKALEKKGAAEQKSVAGVDDGNGLIAAPSNSNAMEDTHQNLEQKGGRVKIAHPSSHTEWDKHVQQLSNDEQRELLKSGKYKTLEDVPIEKLENSINNIREQLRKDLLNAAKKLEKGNYNNLPGWIDPKYQLKPDPKKAPPSQTKKYPRLVQKKPTGDDINEFRRTLVALKAKIGQGTQKHSLYNKRTDLNADERQIRTLGYSAMLAVKNNNGYSSGQPFVFQHKGSEVGIYRRGDYTQIAIIDLQQGIISVDKPFNSVEDSWLAEQQKVVLAQAQETQKTRTQKNRGFEMG